MKLVYESKECPYCEANLVGAEIREEDREFYGKDVTHFSRLIGVEEEGKDRVCWWRCPDCGKEDVRDW